MTIRFYKPIATINISKKMRKTRLVREYRNVDRIQIIEDLKLVVMYINGQEEKFIYNDCRMEIVEDIVDNDEKQAYCTSLWLNDLYQMYLGREKNIIACSKCKYVEKCNSTPPVMFNELFSKINGGNAIKFGFKPQ